jgi:hypothetical protein
MVVIKRRVPKKEKDSTLSLRGFVEC